MKILVATVALATLLTSDALAQSRWQGAYRSYGLWRAPSLAYALQIRPVGYYSYRRVSRGWNVYDTSGNWVGRDPDPRVRAMIAHDPHPGD
jgi:hypothetical protein